MTDVHICIVRSNTTTGKGKDMLIEDGELVGPGELLTTPATSTLTPAVAGLTSSDSLQYYAWRITNQGAVPIDVAFGTTPSATQLTVGTTVSTPYRTISAGMVAYIGVRHLADKVGVADS